ncbi:MAG TPA: protein jag [Elainellaceae cyanobacterium]
MNTQHQLKRGQDWLEQFLKLSALPCHVHVDETQLDAEGSCWLIVDSTPLTPEQIQTLIGDHGSVLDAIQYLANTTLNLGQPAEQQQAYTVELDGYRARRQVELQSMAEEAARQVRHLGDEHELASLSAAERRQVHTFLKAFDDLETYSRGKEPDRRLVVRRRQEESPADSEPID